MSKNTIVYVLGGHSEMSYSFISIFKDYVSIASSHIYFHHNIWTGYEVIGWAKRRWTSCIYKTPLTITAPHQYTIASEHFRLHIPVRSYSNPNLSWVNVVSHGL